MARIAGVDLPRKKRIEIGLTYIYGIGRSQSQNILTKLRIDPDTKTDDLTEDQITNIRKLIDDEYKVEGELRHRRGLPVRGQRTCTNARTRKGPKRTAVKKKGGAKKK